MSLPRKLLILIFFLLPAISMKASDDHDRDSIEAVLKGNIADTTRIHLLFELAGMIGSSDTTLSYSYLEQGRTLAKQSGNSNDLGIYHKILGKVLARSGSYEKAIHHYDLALAHFKTSGDNDCYYETIKQKGNVYLFGAEYPEALYYYELALDYYIKSDQIIGISRCLNNMGIIHKNRGEYVEALTVYQESVLYLDSIADAGDISQAYINMGNVFVLMGSYGEAMEYFGRALEIAERFKQRHNIALCLSNAGVVQNKIGHYEEAHTFYQRSLHVARSLNDPVHVSNCLINLGTNYAEMGEPEKGLEYVKQGMAIKSELGDERTISNCIIHLAGIYAIMGEYEQAIELYGEAIPEKERLSDPDGLIRCYLGLGSLALEQKHFNEAERMTNKAMEIAQEIGAMEYLSETFMIKKKIAVGRGDYRSAYNFAMQNQLYNDSLMDKATARAAMEMEFRNRSKILQQENENLRIQSNLDQLEMRKRTVIFRSSLVIVSILLLALALVLYYMRRHKRTSDTLEEKNLVITRQNLKLDQINKTKNRMMSIIAHDLRGTIGNQLTAVEVLNRVEEGGVEIDRKRLLGNLKNSASYSLELLENLLHWSQLEMGEASYHPESVKLNTLINNCLSLYSENINNKKLEVKREIKEDISCQVDKIMMESIFRNLLSNAIKFSKRGDQISIGLRLSNDEVHFWISDQGLGLSTEDIRKIEHSGGFTRRGTANEKGAGMGLTLVREFAHLHRGKLTIQSESGKGSTFEVIIPCIN